MKDIELIYNATSGEIEYKLISSNFTEIEDLIDQLEADDFVSELNATVAETYPSVIIETIENNSEDGIEVEISVTVDTTNASENLKEANDEIENILISDLGFEEADSKATEVIALEIEEDVKKASEDVSHGQTNRPKKGPIGPNKKKQRQKNGQYFFTKTVFSTILNEIWEV